MIARLLVGLATALAVISPCYAAADDVPINSVAHLSALTRTDRAPRSWKLMKLVPGKVTYWYYEWIREDGTPIVQVLNHKLKQAPDRRPLRESHPNLAILVPSMQAGGSLVMSGLFFKR